MEISESLFPIRYVPTLFIVLIQVIGKFEFESDWLQLILNPLRASPINWVAFEVIGSLNNG